MGGVRCNKSFVQGGSLNGVRICIITSETELEILADSNEIRIKTRFLTLIQGDAANQDI